MVNMVITLTHELFASKNCTRLNANFQLKSKIKCCLRINYIVLSFFGRRKKKCASFFILMANCRLFNEYLISFAIFLSLVHLYLSVYWPFLITLFEANEHNAKTHTDKINIQN